MAMTLGTMTFEEAIARNLQSPREVTLDSLLGLDIPEKAYRYDQRDCMLYAAGIGMGADPMDRRQLDFVYEKNLKVMPSMATVIAWDDSLLFDSGINLFMSVHGEQRLTVHRPLPPTAEILSRPRITAAYDKGEDRGALLVIENTLRESGSDAPLCTMESVVFARGDGGFGGPSGGPEKLPNPPERTPDAVASYATLPQAALLYRLSGDPNPLHCDPDFAAKAGFDRPILHGLCTWGNACHAIVAECCDYRPERLTGFAARFTAPVFPGETIETSIWRTDTGAQFRSRIVERDVVVLNQGLATISA